MTGLLLVRILLGLAGLAAFAFGVRVESSAIRWAGIAVLAAALALRFLSLPPRPRT